jgi:hypothetical protein
MIRRWAVLAASIGVAGCGSSDGSLFGRSDNDRGRDAATRGDASSASDGSSSRGGAAGSGASDSGGGGAAASGSSSGGRGASPDAGGGADTSGSGGAGGGTAAGGKGGAQPGGTGGGRSAGSGGVANDSGVPTGVATPMSISCGTSTCTITSGLTDVCCALPLAFPPFPTGCFPVFPGCVTTGVPFACDDAADCTNGDVCCGSTAGTACGKTCPSGKVQFCRTNAECNGGECRPWSTATEYSTCQ